MNRRIVAADDASLNATVGVNDGEGTACEWQDWLESMKTQIRAK